MTRLYPAIDSDTEEPQPAKSTPTSSVTVLPPKNMPGLAKVLAGIYIVHFDHFPPSFEITFFPRQIILRRVGPKKMYY